jgi:hypothetical protein
VTSPRSSPDRPTNGWALAAFVLAILGGILLSVIFAILALIQLSKGGGQRGRGLAVAALAISAGVGAAHRLGRRVRDAR